jgi:hypothetical protein
LRSRKQIRILSDSPTNPSLHQCESLKEIEIRVCCYHLSAESCAIRWLCWNIIFLIFSKQIMSDIKTLNWDCSEKYKMIQVMES